MKTARPEERPARNPRSLTQEREKAESKFPNLGPATMAWAAGGGSIILKPRERTGIGTRVHLNTLGTLTAAMILAG